MSDKLKPCPFCGGRFLAYTAANGPLDGMVQMVCGCGARGPAVDDVPGAWPENIDAAWNLRTPDWQELARELACIAAEQRLPYTCDSCGHKTDKPCPTDALGLCEAQRWYPTEVIVAMAVKAGLLEG